MYFQKQINLYNPKRPSIEFIFEVEELASSLTILLSDVLSQRPQMFLTVKAPEQSHQSSNKVSYVIDLLPSED